VPWIERDHFQAGRLAASRLIRQGFHAITIITRERPMPGDYPMTDGVRDEMSAAGLPLSAISWRPLPSDPLTVRHAVSDLLRENGDKRGFICRSRPLADRAAEAITMEGMRLGADAGVVVLDVYQVAARKTPPFPYLSPTMSPEEIGQRIGHMLLIQAKGEKPHPGRIIIPMELCEPYGAED
jgi:DNA-binding LacI/PurR family transcriptional regulator